MCVWLFTIECWGVLDEWICYYIYIYIYFNESSLPSFVLAGLKNVIHSQMSKSIFVIKIIISVRGLGYQYDSFMFIRRLGRYSISYLNISVIAFWNLSNIIKVMWYSILTHPCQKEYTATNDISIDSHLLLVTYK